MKVEFVKSSSDFSQCPSENKAEYAFIGRSNVGKSSLINNLVKRKNLAKISSTPGKTQLINHFMVDDEWYLVDLPGYGWARTSKTNKATWEGMTFDYLTKRKNLMCVFLLIDSKIPAQNNDMDFMEWMGEMGIPFVLVFTKTDKLSKNKSEKSIKGICDEFLKNWEELPQMFKTSSVTGDGKEELLKFIAQTNQVFK